MKKKTRTVIKRDKKSAQLFIVMTTSFTFMKNRTDKTRARFINEIYEYFAFN